LLAGWVPLPAREIVVGEMAASLTSEMLPDTLLVAVGANCTLKVLDCRADGGSGDVGTLSMKPAPVKLPCTMVKVALPDVVILRLCSAVLPNLPSFPLRRAAELLLAGCVPLPAREIVVGEMAASLTSETLPDTLPVAVGANCTLKV